MDLRDFSNMGRQIKDIVSDAVDTMDFRRLDSDLHRTVNEMLNDINQKSKGFYYQPKDEHGRPIYTEPPNRKKHRRKNTENNGFTGYQSADYQSGTYSDFQSGSTAGAQSDWGHYNYGYQNADQQHMGSQPTGNNYNHDSNAAGNDYNHNRRAAKPAKYGSNIYDVGFPVLKNPPGRISSVLLMTLGYTFTGIFGLTDLILLICGFAIPDATAPMFITAAGLLPLLIAGIICAVIGTKKHGRLKRYKGYLKALKGKTFASFKELTSVVGKSAGYIRKDIRWFIDNGYFPEGHIDEQKTCVMLTDNIYNQYLETQNNYKNRQAAAQAATQAHEASMTESENDELQKIAEDGKRYMQRIREANDAIPDTEISNKLYRMELIVEKIFDYAKKNPDQIPQLRRFMEYYMPTTDKLVNAYKEFDTQPIQGENIKNAKAEIAKALDTINYAYEKLYDSMYMEAAMDVSSDISVLQTLLAQEGLTKNAFEKERN